MISSPKIEVRGVSRTFRSTTALNGVNLTFSNNSITALLGANGAGKTTLMGILAGHDRPSSGSVLVDGRSPFESSDTAAHTSFIRDNQRYPDNYSLRHALRAAGLFHPYWDLAYATKLVEKFRLPPCTPIQKFSRGQLSSLAIVISLASRAPLTIFDEPYLGLDISARELFYESLIVDFAQPPRTIIISTHLVQEMENMFDQVVILADGHVITDSPADELRGGAFTASGPHDAVQNFLLPYETLQSRRLGGLTTAVARGDYLAAKAAANGSEILEISPVSLQEIVAAIGEMSHEESAQ